MFLVGAYQEILGDLHNLFGDTNAVHVSLHEHGYQIDHVVEGDSVTEVLGYVQYEKRDLMQRMRQASEDALRRQLLTFEESALLMKRFEEGLAGYTYLEEEAPALGGVQIAGGSAGLTATPLQPQALQPQNGGALATPQAQNGATPAAPQVQNGMAPAPSWARNAAAPAVPQRSEPTPAALEEQPVPPTPLRRYRTKSV